MGMSMMGSRVMIADDVAEMRQLLRKILMDLGHEVCGEAASGDKALQMIQSQQPDIVFLDIEMPGLSGLEVLDQIRGLPKKVFTIIVSAHSTFDNVQTALGKGADGFIVKPYAQKKIADVLERYARSRAAA